MKYCVWSRILEGYTPEQVARMVSAAGYDGIEWRVHETGHLHPGDLGSGDREGASVGASVWHLRNVTEGAGLETVNLGSYATCDQLDLVEHLVRAAEAMASPHVRVWPPFYDGTVPYGRLLDDTRRSLERVVRLVDRTAVRVTMEIHHGTIMPSCELARRLVDGFDPRLVGVLFDPGNMAREGLVRWQMGLEVLGGYLAYAHFKNCAWFDEGAGMPGGAGAGPEAGAAVGARQGRARWRPRWTGISDGMVDWGEVMYALKRVGFDGYLSNENFAPLPVSQKLSGDLLYMKDLAARVEQAGRVRYATEV